MSNHISHSALPYPIKNARFSLSAGFRLSTGVLTDPTTPDTEYSIDGGATFADTAEEITTGGANGAGYLTLTGAETNNSAVILACKSANDLTTLVTLIPRVLAIVGSGTLSAGTAGGGTLGTLLAYDVTGCFIRTTGGTGGGGTGGANNQARKLITYDTTTGAFTVAPNWETTPSTDTTYDVLLPEGVTLGMLRTLNPTTAGRKLNVATGGEADADLVKILTVAQSATDAKDFFDDGYDPATNKVQGVVLVDTLTTYTGNTPQTGDVFPLVSTEIAEIKAKTDNLPSDPADQSAVEAAITAATSGLATAANLQIVDDFVDDLEGRLTASRAGYLDNLNVGGAVASQADINALNQSASRRIMLVTVPQYERPESGTNSYTVECRTYTADGASVNADSTPTLTATGIVSGDLSANLSVASNPATGVYRWTYSEVSAAVIEQIRMDVSATISAETFTLSAFTQSCDFVAATWTTTDRTKLTALYDDWADDGRLDVILDARSSQASVDTGFTTVISALGVIDDFLDTEIALIISTLGVAGAGLTAVPWNATWDAQVESEVDDALIAKGLDHLVFTSVTGTDVADNSIIARLVSKSATADWDSFTNTTDSLEGIFDGIAGIVTSMLAATGDTGVSLSKVLEIVAAFVAGKISAVSAGGVTTYTYKKRDGTTTSFTSLCSETDGTRATTGALS